GARSRARGSRPGDRPPWADGGCSAHDRLRARAAARRELGAGDPRLTTTAKDTAHAGEFASPECARGPSENFDQMVTIGRAVKPQGRHGEIAVEVLTDRPERFDDLRKVFVPGPYGVAREVEVERTWPHKGRVIVKLKGVDSIDVAESYRGMDLRIAEED